MRQLDLSAFEAAVTSENLAVRGMRVFQAGQLIAQLRKYDGLHLFDAEYRSCRQDLR